MFKTHMRFVIFSNSIIQIIVNTNYTELLLVRIIKVILYKIKLNLFIAYK